MSYEPIPSLGYLYEIDTRGNVRNVKTKRQLKKKFDSGSLKYQLWFNGKKFTRGVQSLLWEVHGVEPNLKNLRAIGVTIRKGAEAYFFESLRKCSEFLSRRERLHPATLKKFLCQRESEICGWSVTYHEQSEV